jgi:hypothetical protein
LPTIQITVPNARLILNDELGRIWKEMTVDYFNIPHMNLEQLRKPQENFCQDNQSSSKNLSPGPPKHEAVVLATISITPWCSVCISNLGHYSTCIAVLVSKWLMHMSVAAYSHSVWFARLYLGDTVLHLCFKTIMFSAESLIYHCIKGLPSPPHKPATAPCPNPVFTSYIPKICLNIIPLLFTSSIMHFIFHAWSKNSPSQPVI